MKKSLIFILILALPFISSLTVDMKSSYNQGETIIAGISGNIVDPIQEANIIFYRGHVQIPMDYDVARIGENFYVKASLLGKTSGDYSMRIENIHYYKSGFLTNEPVTTNFSINSTMADFSINPGFILSSSDFFIQVQNLKDSPITITITSPSKILSESSVTISSQTTKAISFQLGDITQDLFGSIILKTSNLEYTIPIYILATKGYCGNSKIDTGESCDGSNWGPVTGCADFGFTSGALSCLKCAFDTSKCVTDSPIQAYCGDGKIDAGEQCDGSDWGNIKNCSDFGFNDGSLSCSNCEFDTSKCFNSEVIDKGCVNNSGCSSGYCLINKAICVECLEKSNCPSGEFCSDSFKCIECRLDIDCGSGKICSLNGVCESQCTLPSDCASGVCSDDGICVECTEDTNCLNNKVCSDKNTCVECKTNSICGAGKLCDNTGTCIPECTEDSQCSGDDVCSYDGACVECRNKRDCGENEICSSDGKCMAECSVNTDCPTGRVCEDKVCVECMENRDCDEDNLEECKDGECVLKHECEKTTDCKDDKSCINYQCIFVRECTNHTRCGTNEECINYKCVIKEQCSTSKPCGVNKTCQAGICIDSIAQKTCTELGGAICKTGQSCEGDSRKIRTNICCLGTCIGTTTSSSSSTKTIGWGLVIVAVLLMVFFYLRYMGAKKKSPDLVKIGLRR